MGRRHWSADRADSVRWRRLAALLLKPPQCSEAARSHRCHLVASVASVDRYGWTGREYDIETAMHYHRARYYSQSLRRFIQEDPVEGSTSPYAYVHGSPLEATDPSGMMDSYESQVFHEFCTGRGTCMNAYGGVSHPSDNDGFELPSGGGGDGGSRSVDLVAQMADGSEIPCASIAEKCAAFMEANGDPLMNNPALFDHVANNLETSPWDSKYPLYQREVGGWCSATTCTMKIGSISGMGGNGLGKQPRDAILGYHTHPNVGLPVINGGADHYAAYPSLDDLLHGMKPQYHYTVPMYVISYQSVYRYDYYYNPGQQPVVSGCYVFGGKGDACQ